MIIFHTPEGTFRIVKDPGYYAEPYEDDYWYLWYRFGKSKKYAVGEETRKVSLKNFYDNWPVSLRPDALLGYFRKENVTIPGHETSNFATRSLKKYRREGEKILFYGDSFVESQAFSDDTITAKIERKTGIDTLNYGVGGYGFDQIYLLFKETYAQFDVHQCIILFGLTPDDLDRLLLKVRTSPKPYYLINNDRLVLKTEHIDKNNLESFYNSYDLPLKSYLLGLMKRKMGLSLFWDIINKEEVERKKNQITQLILEKLSDIRYKKRLKIYFVLFYPEKDIYTEEDPHLLLKKMLKQNNFSYLDLRECLKKHITKTNLGLENFYHGHPSSEGNEVFSDCIIKYILK
ncbi:MAG: hypothetical protein JW928_09375 [Candidatus Aureabacteria bacterium]|nr:hypothetical protein [Candidatus Auribacterota bacterium]